MTKNPHIVLFLAENNFSDIEYIKIKNRLTNEKIPFSILSISNNYCKSDKNRTLAPDLKLYNFKPFNFDALILVGGSGILNYLENDLLKKIVITFKEQNKYIAAICSAPILLDNFNILRNSEITCYPENKHFLKNNTFTIKTITIHDKIICAQSYNEAIEMVNLLIKKLR